MLSFCVGTGLMIVYYFDMSTITVLYSFYIVFAIVVLNIILLLFLFFKGIQGSITKDSLKRSAIILSANIPVAILYYFFVTFLLGILRITVVNQSGSDISNVRIIGCEDKKIDILENKDFKTVWLKIPNDCSVDVTFTKGGKDHTQNVVGYATVMMGQKVIYEIK